MDVNDKIKKLLEKNTISDYSNYLGRDFHFMKPSEGVYKSQYFWDTCFHVFMMCEAGMAKMAEKCMDSLFALQKEDGFVGHILYWKQKVPSRITDLFQNAPSLKFLYAPNMSRIIQPPLAAEAVWRIYKKTNDPDFLKRISLHLKKYYQYLWNKRRSRKTGLINIISYFESGMDWKPSYDPVINLKPGKANWNNFVKVVWIDVLNFLTGYNLEKIFRQQRFIVSDAGFNTIAALNYQVMGQICEELEDPEASEFYEYSSQIKKSIKDHLYDANEKAFYDLDETSGELLKIKTPTIFYPLLLDILSEEEAHQIIKTHYLDKNTFYTPYPIPSVEVNHPSFNPKNSIYIWRGPTWAVNNYFLYQVLKKYSFETEADQLKQKMGELINKGGFREYYNPYTGQGYGAEDFTWSGLYICMI